MGQLAIGCPAGAAVSACGSLREAGTCRGHGIWQWCSQSGFTVWACSILPEHVHLVIARHTYPIERVANLLKGEATKSLKQESLHPQARHADARGKIPSLWAEGQWKVFLDSEAAIESAIRYVEENPVKEGKPPQKWSFVTPFAGIDRGGWTTYH